MNSTAISAVQGVLAAPAPAALRELQGARLPEAAARRNSGTPAAAGEPDASDAIPGMCFPSTCWEVTHPLPVPQAWDETQSIPELPCHPLQQGPGWGQAGGHQVVEPSFPVSVPNPQQALLPRPSCCRNVGLQALCRGIFSTADTAEPQDPICTVPMARRGSLGATPPCTEPLGATGCWQCHGACGHAPSNRPHLRDRSVPNSDTHTFRSRGRAGCPGSAGNE